MRIGTFNVENLEAPLGARATVLRPAFARLDADIVCLQEVNGQHVKGRHERVLAGLDELLAGTRYADYARAATTAANGNGAADVHNLVILSRLPILAHRQLRHGLLPPVTTRLVTADPPAEAPVALPFDRPLLVAEIDAGGRRLTIVNVHLRAPLAAPIPGHKIAPFKWNSVAAWAEGYYLSGLKRSGQALELRLLADSLFDADANALLLVAGDFNAEAHETPLRMVVGAPEDTGNGALTGRALVPLARALDPARAYSVLHHGRPQLLDHMLASHALYGHFKGIEVHNEALGDEAIGYGKGAEPAGSYHAALVATFSLG
jgi:endonuclease/exonuclease/phosphatase family metal-dependent hydrolase